MKKLTNLTVLPQKTQKLLDNYLYLKIGNCLINCPYWMNDLPKNIKGPYSGKGTPKQIIHAIKLCAKKHGLDVINSTKTALSVFMKNNRIGIDCSGLAYHLSDRLNIEKYGFSLAKKFFPDSKLPSWRNAWRCNAEFLTNIKNARPIKVAHAKPGDLIRLNRGKHIFFITVVSRSILTYVHSSSLTSQLDGVHLGKIKIIDPNLGLDHQCWLEKTKEYKKYGHIYFDSSQGDGIYRFRWQI
ncbi:hypothetical protein HZB69_03130 [Candidatus Amesbacteria bacterium]|nr:hypothetical protein [Candidatus Amesbacteria bacterium]